MKKILEMIGLSILICFSFVLTEKTSMVMKDNDQIMNTVKENQEKIKQPSINATINNDEIIPGISGKKINVEQSYKVMKEIGYYKENLLVYDKVEPVISIKDNYDKYIISGNNKKKEVSIIFKINNNQNIDSIINLLESKQIKSNFAVSSNWILDNIKQLQDISNKGNVFTILDFKDNQNIVTSIIKINTTQKNYYCYLEKKEVSILKECSKNKNYTIIPSYVINNNLLSTVMNNLSSGNIISISINKANLEEISNTLEYIKKKGFEIVTLDKLLEE